MKNKIFVNLLASVGPILTTIISLNVVPTFCVIYEKPEKPSRGLLLYVKSQFSNTNITSKISTIMENSIPPLV